MRIFITGVAGFIGSNLAERLISKGHSVFGIDNLSHGRISNIDGIIDSARFTFYESDLCNGSDWMWPLMEFNPEIIVHLASEKIPRYSDSYKTLSLNYQMTEKVCELSDIFKARLIFASTSDIYGRNLTPPFKEDSEFVLGNTDVKRWSYAVSKMHSEHYIIARHDRMGIDYTILRFFSCYGKNQASGWWGGAQSAFMDKIIAGEAVEIHGSGMQSRCFTYIDDAIDGIMLAIANKNAINEIFNIGNPGAYVTMYGLYKLLIGFLDKYVPVKYIPYAELGKYEDSNIKIPDIEKAKRVLGFSPKCNLHDGLKKTIEWKLNKTSNG